jgi:hypothetical protein
MTCRFLQVRAKYRFVHSFASSALNNARQLTRAVSRADTERRFVFVTRRGAADRLNIVMPIRNRTAGRCSGKRSRSVLLRDSCAPDGAAAPARLFLAG